MNKLLKFLTAIITLYLCGVMLLSIVYLYVPPVSTLMLARWVTSKPVSYTPVPLKRISPHLIRMVIRAEDSRFCKHHGVDWKSMEYAIKDAASNGATRGASTISMQVTKNLFLWPQQSYIRKIIEVPLTMGLSILWSKHRVMEMYLSIAEWGTGIYGAEAAAQKYFNKSASNLTRTEAANLAAALPNPIKRNPSRPTGYYAKYAKTLRRGATENINTSCLH